MLRTTFLGTAMVVALSGMAWGETIDVQMLNKGIDGERMVFEPSFVRIAPGDTVKFIATDRGHNAELIGGLAPKGAEAFAGKINEEIEVTFDGAGVYGVQCKPHYAMGMVMTIAVGDVNAPPDDYLEGRIPRKAKSRIEAQLNNL